MANVATITPLNQFFDTNGSPLNSGYLYFGSVNQDPEQFPVQMYWDADGTVPALQPIRTISGYPSRAGSPAIIYGPDSYSLRVKSSASVQVLYAPNLGGLTTSASLSASGGSALVGHIDGVPGSVATTVQARLRKMPDKSTGFWPDAVPAGVIQRQYDRVFIGGATLADGTLANVVKDWLETERNFTTRNSQFATTSTIGQSAVLGGSRTSDSLGVGSMGCIGVSGYAINNNATQVQFAYAGYFEARKKTGAGTTHGIEIDIVNQGAGGTVTPFAPAPVGMTNALWLASGGGVAGAVAASIGMGIINNGTTFDRGILFQANAITGTDGVTGVGTAIAMAKGHVLTWFNSSGSPTTNLYSAAASSTIGSGMVFDDGSAKIINSSPGTTQFDVVYTATNVNYISPINADAGSGPSIRALGTDANIDIRLSPKGTGVLAVTYGSTVAAVPANFSATRTLAFKDGNNITWYIPISTVTW